MKTTTKRIWLALVIVIAFAVVVGLLWKKEPPQFLTLPTGEIYQLAGLTYGTSPAPPALAARLIRRLPTPVANLIRRYFKVPFDWYNADDRFPTPRLFVWFLPIGSNTTPTSRLTSLATVLTDQDGVVAGAKGGAAFSSGVGWAYTSFPVVPRRSRELQCEFYTNTPGIVSGTATPVGKVTFRNPLFGRFPQWQPELGLAIKKAGDLEVRLDGMSTERRMEGPLTNLFNTSYHVSLRSPEGTNGIWALECAELSDVTGNALRQTWVLPGTIQDVAQPLLQSDGWLRFNGSLPVTLWPDEAAWRLKLEWKRASGWAPGEVVIFRNVPLLRAGATNSLWMTNMVGQLQVVLEEHMRRGTHPINQSFPRFRLEVPDGFAADVVRMTTDKGVEVPINWGAEMGPGSKKPLPERSYSSTRLSSATNVDLTWVVQKPRTVEFLVKSPKAE